LVIETSQHYDARSEKHKKILYFILHVHLPALQKK